MEYTNARAALPTFGRGLVCYACPPAHSGCNRDTMVIGRVRGGAKRFSGSKSVEMAQS
jgi:hypothetical protein